MTVEPELEDYEPEDLAFSINDKGLSPERTEYYNQIFKAITEDTYQGEVKTASINTAQLESTTNSTLLSEWQLKKLYPYAVPLNNPLTYDFLARIHDNIRRDGAPRRVLKIITQFMLGKRQKPALALAEEYYDEQEEENALATMKTNSVYKDIITELCDIDRKCNTRKNFKALAFSGLAYGRSVLVKQYNNEMIPKKLLHLSSLRLGAIWVDRRDWTYYGVEYLDYNTSNRIIPAKHIIHYEYDDLGITPNDRWFGMPLLEGLTALIESNRITAEVVIPELSKKSFAPQQIIVVPDAKSKEKLREIAALILPGKTTVLRKMIDVKTIELVVDILMQTQKIKDVDMKVTRDSGVPVGIMFPSEPNRATMGEELNAWTEGQLADMRTDLRDCLEPQWYIPNAKQIVVNKKIFFDKAESLPINPLQPNQPQKQGQATQNALKPIPTIQIKTASASPWWSTLSNGSYNLETVELPFDVKLTFDDIVIEDFVNKAAAIIGYKNAGIIDERVSLDLAGLDKYKDQLSQNLFGNAVMNVANEQNLYNEEKARMQQAGNNIANVLNRGTKPGINMDVEQKQKSKLSDALSKLRRGGSVAVASSTPTLEELQKNYNVMMNNAAITMIRMEILDKLKVKLDEL